MKGSSAVISPARQEAAARLSRSEETITAVEKMALANLDELQQWLGMEGSAQRNRDGLPDQDHDGRREWEGTLRSVRSSRFEAERSTAEALQRLVDARDEHASAHKALMRIIEQEEAKAVLRGHTRERFGRLAWWQRPGRKVTGITVASIGGLFVGELTTGAVGLFFTWVGHGLGIGGG